MSPLATGGFCRLTKMQLGPFDVLIEYAGGSMVVWD